MAWNADREWKRARRLSGLARFERVCRRLTPECGRLKLAWKVPATAENGRREVYRRICDDLYYARFAGRDAQKQWKEAADAAETES